MMRTFLIARSSSSFTRYYTTHIPLTYLLQNKQNSSVFFFSSFSSGRKHPKDDTFAVSYLINSCGVPPTLARELAHRVNLKTPDGPNAVIDILNNYGFSKIQIAKLVQKFPSVLVAKAQETLLPKLKFLHSIGISNTDMPKILLRNSNLLTGSLKNCLIPRYKILRGILQDDHEVVRVFKKTAFSITYCDMKSNLVPKIELLRQSHVPQASISLLMVHFYCSALLKHSKFVEALNRAKEIGFDPLKINFIHALVAILVTSKTLWDSKLEVYEKWGWNHQMTFQAFRKNPRFVMLSKDTYSKKMSFLVKDMGLPSEDIFEYPLVLSFSLEKRIIPRFSVIKILRSKGLLKKKLQLSSFICLNEKNFMKKFIIKFQDDLPHLSDVYKGLIDRQYSL